MPLFCLDCGEHWLWLFSVQFSIMSNVDVFSFGAEPLGLQDWRVPGRALASCPLLAAVRARYATAADLTRVDDDGALTRPLGAPNREMAARLRLATLLRAQLSRHETTLAEDEALLIQVDAGEQATSRLMPPDERVALALAAFET